jgi:hypothetical protein
MKTPLIIAAAAALSLAPAARAQVESPSPSPSPAAPPKTADPPPIKQLSKDEFQLGDIRFNKSTRRIEFPGHINTREDLIEYTLVHQDGKTHESLLATAVSPFQLNIVMLLCGYQPNTQGLFGDTEQPVTTRPAKETPLSQILLTVTWTPEGEAPVTLAPEDLILNRFTGKPMTRGPWQYNGSTVENGDFQAELEGSIIALYLDRYAMFNSPRPGSDDDQRWRPLTEKLPPRDTPVTISIAPAPPHQSE